VASPGRFLDHLVESAELAAMAPEHVFDVEGTQSETSPTDMKRPLHPFGIAARWVDRGVDN
jgi:hypothetical protein